MDKKNITFGDLEIKKRKFLHGKNLILSEDADMAKIQVYNLVSSGEKYHKNFIGYKDDYH